MTSSDSRLDLRRRYEVFGVICAILAVAAAYLWSIHGLSTVRISREPQDFYGFLTDALLDRQLHLKIAPDPRLFALANPYAGAQDVPRLHDASFFNGHYYLYFGATPVFILFGPWRLLSGSFLSEGLGITIFVFVGFILGVRLWVRLKRVYFDQLSVSGTVLGILMIGLGNYTLFLIQTPVVYHVPLSCAYACIMAGLNAFDFALSSRTTGRQVVGVGLGSFLWALAIGARPNYLFSLPAAVIPLVFLWRQPGRGTSDRVRLALWTMVPPALVGAWLAWYNYMRFGSISEFGVTYQFAAGDLRNVQLTGLGHFGENLATYFVTGAYHTPYFPFAWAVTDTIGAIVWAPFIFVGLASPFALPFKKNRTDRRWIPLVLILLVSVTTNLFSLGLFAYTNARYVADFLPAGTLVSLLAVGAFSTRGSTVPRWLSRSSLFVACILAGTTFMHSVAYGLQHHARAEDLRGMAKLTDYPARVWEPMIGVQHGAVRLDLTFATLRPGQVDPLVATSEGRDSLYVRHLDEQHVAFGYFHAGSGGPLGDPVVVEPGRHYVVECDMGSLYPPAEHPAYAGWDPSLIDSLHRRVDVRLDGRTVLHWSSSFYPSQPFETKIGENPSGLATSKRFSGTIIAHRREGLPPAEKIASLAGNGPIRITVKFPPFKGFFGEPLLSTGRPGAGDLVYVRYLAPGKVRFGLDSWSNGYVDTPDVEFDPESEHVIDIDLPSLHSDGKSSLFCLRFDQRQLVALPAKLHPSSPSDIVVGFNATGCTAAAQLFTGPTLRAERIPVSSVEAQRVKEWGAIELSVRFPPFAAVGQEPLVVSGRSGAGDLIYAVYVDATHLRIGYDHWAVSAGLSEPIEIDYSHAYLLSVSLGSLYPEPNSPWWKGVSNKVKENAHSVLKVELGQQVVLETPLKAYPARPEEVYIGKNPIGGSTCGPAFTGQMLSADRDGLPR
jgi:hypothetical protein